MANKNSYQPEDTDRWYAYIDSVQDVLYEKVYDLDINSFESNAKSNWIGFSENGNTGKYSFTVRDFETVKSVRGYFMFLMGLLIEVI